MALYYLSCYLVILMVVEVLSPLRMASGEDKH